MTTWNNRNKPQGKTWEEMTLSWNDENLTWGEIIGTNWLNRTKPGIFLAQEDEFELTQENGFDIIVDEGTMWTNRIKPI